MTRNDEADAEFVMGLGGFVKDEDGGYRVGPKFPDVYVPLAGEDGNAFAILGRVERALRRAGHDDAVVQFMDDATAGDYDHLLATVMLYVNTAKPYEGEEEW